MEMWEGFGRNWTGIKAAVCTKAEGERERAQLWNHNGLSVMDLEWRERCGMEKWEQERQTGSSLGRVLQDMILSWGHWGDMFLNGVWHGQFCVCIKSNNSTFVLLNMELASKCPCLGDAHWQPQADTITQTALKKENLAFTPGEHKGLKWKPQMLNCGCHQRDVPFLDAAEHPAWSCVPHGSFSSVQFSSVAQLCLTFWDPMNCSMPGLPVPHHLPEFTQTQVHWVHDAIQPSHPRSSPSSLAPSTSQH